jgi:hypothetical protein
VIPGDRDMKIHILVSYTVYKSTIINMATAKKLEFIANKSNVDRMCTNKQVLTHNKNKNNNDDND